MCSYLTTFRIGPEIHGVFGNGRLERFFAGKTAEAEELREERLFKVTAQELARLHRVPVPAGWDNGLFHTIRKWLAQVRAAKFEDPVKVKVYESLQLVELAQEVDELEKCLTKATCPVALSHNDLLSANILFESHEDGAVSAMHFVDFEYGMTNWVAFDIANHFNEWSSFDEQLAGIWQFPDDATGRRFAELYLTAYNGSAPEPHQLDQFYKQVLAFSLASNVFWGLWAVIQEVISNIDFDYLGYGKCRLERYRSTKQWRDLI